MEQVGHAFFFGAHTFNFSQLGNTERNSRHKELFGALFNSGAVALFVEVN